MLAAFTQDVMTRSGGFNSINLGDMNTETIAVTNAMMFIGGGSASTAGGIKVTTFLLLAFVIWAELRGEPDVTIRNRRIAEETPAAGRHGGAARRGAGGGRARWC